MLGRAGPDAQLLAFRSSWALASAYVRMIRQAAMGCKQACGGDSRLSTELEALCLVVSDVEAWFASCELGLQELQNKNAGGTPLVH